MSAGDAATQISSACATCRRRAWLLANLGAGLDYRCGDRGRLMDLLALEDQPLLQALAGSRRTTLKASYDRFDPRQLPDAPGVQAICRHDPRHPHRLRGPGSPPMLNVVGGIHRLVELAAAPVVAIVGTRRATDYGVEMAKSLARGLTVSGITVVSGMTDGIAIAAHAGALEVEQAGIAVAGGGLDVAVPARRRSLFERVRRRGCVVSELPRGCEGRRWGPAAAERIVARLAELTVVVEADHHERELAGARIAQALARTVAAVPGRVTSPVSRGSHELLLEGARLVRGPQDVLDLLHDAGLNAPTCPQAVGTKLEPRLASVLERVGAGRDTPGKLIERAEDAGELLLALSELELMGLLARGDGGRYVLRDVLATRNGTSG
jgi:DNA processing protein